MGYSTLHRPQGAALDTGAWCRCPPLCSPAGCRCLPALAAGRGLVYSLLQLGGCPCVTQELPGGWRWGSAGGRGSFCKLNPDGNCPRRGDGRVTSWSLRTHPVCLSFPRLSMLLLYFFSSLLSVLFAVLLILLYLSWPTPNWQLTCLYTCFVFAFLNSARVIS